MTRRSTRLCLALACSMVTLAAGAASGVDPAAGTADASAASMLGFSPARPPHSSPWNNASTPRSAPPTSATGCKQMSSAPNHVGSPHDKANAEWMLARFQEWGWDARIETFSVLYPTPKTESLELVAPEPLQGETVRAAGAGRCHLGDPGRAAAVQRLRRRRRRHRGLVYANQGMPDDYKELARRGVDVRGKIVITRYGGGWRGLKPKLAQEHGAVGCLIYSDPRDDGYGAGDTYPQGRLASRRTACSADRCRTCSSIPAIR